MARTSCEICYILGKHIKPFTDAEVVKECFLSALNILFEKFIKKTQIISQINIQLKTCI